MTKKKIIVGYQVWYSPEGCGENYCGRVRTMDEAEELASKEYGIPKWHFDTGRAARDHRLSGPELANGETVGEEAVGWCGPESEHSIVPIYRDALRAYCYGTDADLGTITALSFDEAKDTLMEMVAEDGWGWVEDVDGARFEIGSRERWADEED